LKVKTNDMARQVSLDSIGEKEPDIEYLTRITRGAQRNIRGIEFPYEISVKVLSYGDIIWNPIAQLKCIQCGFYGRTFYCGPRIAPYYSWREKLNKYNFFLLFLGKINVRARYLDDLNNFNSGEWRSGYYAGNEGTNILKKLVKDRRLETLSYLIRFGKFRMLSEGGGCRYCRTCSIHKKERCKHPEIAAPSPEAIGIDLYAMIPDIEIPPINNYYSVSMIYGNLPGFDHQNTSNVFRNRNQKHDKVSNLENLISVYPVSEIWNPEMSKSRCKSCKFYSLFLCDRRKYREEDLYEHIKNWHLYVIRLKNKINSVEGIQELHQYQLWFHRQGYWESFQLLPLRCPICTNCSLEEHMNGKYKKVNNRSIPFCVSYFNLNPPEKGKNIGYILA